jgi:hypothetical protein
VRVYPGKVIRTFDPARSLGAAMDGHEQGELDRRLTLANISQMLKAGLGPVTYRLRTELGDEAWHWNPVGTFSDAANSQGYWTSSTDAPPGGISLSYGYALPRRGNTVDQANNNGYSRIDDGDEATFWKSNPYLDTVFTHDSNLLHPQWVIVDLERLVPVNAIKILWAGQFATHYTAEYSTEKLTADFGLRPKGGWRRFERGNISETGPDQRIKLLSSKPVMAKYVRILLMRSGRAGRRSADDRDNVGFAIRELSIGRITRHDLLIDRISHSKIGSEQSQIYVSSTDPWHRASDIDKNQEHVGFDRLVATGLTHGQPMMVPVGVLYDTPENAAAEIKYLIDRGIKFSRVELGEEPDGQNVSALDYAALYLQFANAIQKVAPDAVLGGPSFQDIVSNLGERREHAGNGQWLSDVLRYLTRRGHRKDFAFMSFEWYPYDNVCKPMAPQVAHSADLMKRAINALWADGLDRKLPLVITEYGYSPFATAAEDDLEGAIVNLDGVGTFLSMGGDAAYLYGYEPDRVERESACTQGNNMILLTNADGSLTRTATFHAARMMMTEWLQKGGGEHSLITAASDSSLIGTYAVRRPDGRLSVVLLNRDPTTPAMVRVKFDGAPQPAASYDAVQFSHAEYEWDAVLGRPIKDEPPKHFETNLSQAVELPPYSITVLCEK